MEKATVGQNIAIKYYDRIYVYTMNRASVENECLSISVHLVGNTYEKKQFGYETNYEAQVALDKLFDYMMDEKTTAVDLTPASVRQWKIRRQLSDEEMEIDNEVRRLRMAATLEQIAAEKERQQSKNEQTDEGMPENID